LNKGSKPNVRNRHHDTALHVAANIGNVSAASALLSNYNSLFNAPDVEGKTPLHLASSSGFLKTTRVLLISGSDSRDM